MKKIKNSTYGFTLIELLVVIAIIGILASVVLAALNSARSKGADAAVKTNLNTVRNQAELFYNNNNYSYLPAGGATLSITTPCPTFLATGTNMMRKDPNIATAIAQALKQGGQGAAGSSCYNSSTVWAVAVGLKVTPNTSWCVDSTGASKQEAFVAGSAIGATFACK